MKLIAACCLFLLSALDSTARYTRQDSLRGSNGPARAWWDVVKYQLSIEIDTAERSLKGENIISFRIVDRPVDSLQIDLQDSLVIDSARIRIGAGDHRPVRIAQVVREGNVWWLMHPFRQLSEKRIDVHYDLEVYYHGRPRKATNPPWDGGFIWAKDSLGKPWIAVACQGLGASSWWPCKDYQGDEPGGGMVIQITHKPSGHPLREADKLPAAGAKSPHEKEGAVAAESGAEVSLNCISNGRAELTAQEDPLTGFISRQYRYTVRNPINTYNTTFYIGDYAHWHDTLRGENGVLDLDFYPLRHNLAKARKQWAVTKKMLRCFEYWMGPYPFYEDGYKLVESPYLGMEHQSAVAYGNEYKMGYRGRDLSGTGIGLSFDFILIHESGHEWFGNSITARDAADNWLHEGFTTYTETLFLEWIRGKDSAFRYARGQWQGGNALGEVIGAYGVNDKGTSVIYYRGAAVVHMIRMMMHDDQKFRALLRKLNKDFYHGIVSSRQVEDSISRFTGMNLKLFFNQYLRDHTVPVVVGRQRGENISLNMPYNEIDDAFTLPIYDRDGKFVCELSRKPVTIPVKDLPALLNYLIVYVPENSETMPLLDK